MSEPKAGDEGDALLLDRYHHEMQNDIGRLYEALGKPEEVGRAEDYKLPDAPLRHVVRLATAALSKRDEQPAEGHAVRDATTTWHAVSNLLGELDPMWFKRGQTPGEAACASIRALTASRPATQLETGAAHLVPVKLAACPFCEGEGRIDDPNRCLRCGKIGCQLIDCPTCKGTGVTP